MYIHHHHSSYFNGNSVLLLLLRSFYSMKSSAWDTSRRQKQPPTSSTSSQTTGQQEYISGNMVHGHLQNTSLNFHAKIQQQRNLHLKKVIHIDKSLCGSLTSCKFGLVFLALMHTFIFFRLQIISALLVYLEATGYT